MRRSLIAVLLLAGVVSASWMVPGLTWRGVSGVLAQTTDTTISRPESLVTRQDPVPVRPSHGTRGPARFIGLIGILVILGIAVALSNNRKRINWRVVAWGLG